MKKNSIYFIILYLTIQFSYGQDYKEFLPYKHQGLWGLVDSTQQVIIQPTYKNIKIIGKLEYLQFDNKTLIDLSTGKEIPTPGKYKREITIANKKYYLFSNKTKSTLINLKEKDTITLSLTYDNMSKISLTDSKATTKNEYLVGQLDYEKYILLKNNKKLPMGISGTFSDFDLLKNTNKKYVGIAIKKGNKTLVYNNKLQLKKTLISKDNYTLLTGEQLVQVAKIFNEESLRLDCFNCAEILDDSLYIDENLKLPKLFTVKHSNRRMPSITYKNKAGNEIKVRRDLLYGYYSENFYVQTLQFEKTIIIVDNKYVKPGKLMFPKGVLD